MTTQILVLGPGCVRCQTLFEHTKEAIDTLGLDVDVRKVEDMAEMVSRGIFASPALVVNGQVVLAGQVPTVSRIRDLLSSEKQA